MKAETENVRANNFPIACRVHEVELRARNDCVSRLAVRAFMIFMTSLPALVFADDLLDTPKRVNASDEPSLQSPAGVFGVLARTVARVV